MPLHARAVGHESLAAPRSSGPLGVDDHVHVAFARADELTRVSHVREELEVDLRPVGAARVKCHLVLRLNEPAAPGGALVELDHDVTRDREQRVPHVSGPDAHGHVVLPFHLEARVRREEVSRFVGQSERNEPDVFEQIGAPRVTAVLVSERAARFLVDRRMPGGVELSVRTDDGVLVVDLLGAGVELAGLPRRERPTHAGRGHLGRGEPVRPVARDQRGQQERDRCGQQAALWCRSSHLSSSWAGRPCRGPSPLRVHRSGAPERIQARTESI